MDGLHAGLAVVTGIAVVLLLAASVAAAAGWSGGRVWLDRAVLVQAVAALVAVGSGLLVLDRKSVV